MLLCHLMINMLEWSFTELSTYLVLQGHQKNKKNLGDIMTYFRVLLEQVELLTLISDSTFQRSNRL